MAFLRWTSLFGQHFGPAKVFFFGSMTSWTDRNDKLSTHWLHLGFVPAMSASQSIFGRARPIQVCPKLYLQEKKRRLDY